MTNTVYAPRRASDEPALLSVALASPSNGALVVTVEGEIDLSTAPMLDTTVRFGLLRYRVRSLLVDLSAVTYLGLHGIAVLEQLRSNNAAKGISMYLVAVPRACERALEISGALLRFDRRADLPTALATTSRGALAAVGSDGAPVSDRRGVAGDRRHDPRSHTERPGCPARLPVSP